MITKVQGRTASREMTVKASPRLSALEKAMLKWAVIDPEDRVLDASVGAGLVAEYLRRNMQCEVCGVSDRMEDVRQARERLQTCDIVYALPGDIPWRENAFDVVLLKLGADEPEANRRMLSEVYRVLKQGGQLLLGLSCYPAAVSALAGMMAEESVEMRRPLRSQRVKTMLDALRFEHVSWQRTGFGNGVMIAWKPKPGLEALCKEA
ncbi:MAG: class I SAM-dependent methyltransferase [Clostridiales bacterium]|nr:class I SAM-dependent methyltransferase [Clostridiales bacterium]MDO4351113.1 class I SAM-dependent methyltransferase [Eubacteriales bacterium]MDY4008247.1 class I SAM-dependent methyltransferase [Candidatus Limiplasma sp.]